MRSVNDDPVLAYAQANAGTSALFDLDLAGAQHCYDVVPPDVGWCWRLVESFPGSALLVVHCPGMRRAARGIEDGG